MNNQWVQPEGSAVVAGTWIHATSLPDITLDKRIGHFNVANCWIRWLACRVRPHLYNNFPLHAYSSKPIKKVADLVNRLRKDEITAMDPFQINLVTNEEFRDRNPWAPAEIDYIEFSFAWARNVERSI